jgi:hypothetical protein
MFAFLWYFTGLDQALANLGGWFEAKESGDVFYHSYNFLHFMAITYIPALILAPVIMIINWANTPRKQFNTLTGKPLPHIKL